MFKYTVFSSLLFAFVLTSGTVGSGTAASVLPLCDSTASPATPAAPRAPLNLRILAALLMAEPWHDQTPQRGPSAVESAHAVLDSDVALQAGGRHAYFERLASRADCVAAYALRSQAEVLKYRRQPSLGLDGAVNYVYPNDPDPRRQDAAKFVIPATSISLPNQVWLPIPDHAPDNLLVTWDFWWGAEFDYDHSQIHQIKSFWFNSPSSQIWHGIMTRLQTAKSHVHNQPPGGPYLGMLSFNAHGFTVGENATVGVPNARLPYGAPGPQTRNYGSEALGPYDTSVRPEGMEFGWVAEKWTRHWVFFERDPSGDWVRDRPDAPKWDGNYRTYKMSMWMADQDREPVRIFDRLQIAPNPNSPNGWTLFRLQLNVSAGQAARDRMNAGRGPLVAYARNIVMLKGTRLSDAVGLLARPTD